jgi:hypothetical protein
MRRFHDFLQVVGNGFVKILGFGVALIGVYTRLGCGRRGSGAPIPAGSPRVVSVPGDVLLCPPITTAALPIGEQIVGPL